MERGVDFDPLRVPLISQSMRTEEHVNDNHIEWPPFHTISCILVPVRKIEKAEFQIFLGQHFFREMSSVITKLWIQHYKTQWVMFELGG